jgi:hypothetical protein
MAFTFLHAEIVTLHTPEEVRAKGAALQALGGSDSEREVKARRKAHLKGKILGGEMLAFHWAIGHVTSDGSATRVNGQHSSAVLLALTSEEWAHVALPVVIIEEHYACETPRDRAYLFAQFDPGWSSRTREDTIGPHLALQRDLAAMDRYAANRATQGLQWYGAKVLGDTKLATDPRGQFDLLYQNADIHIFLHFCRSLGLHKRKTAEMGLKPVVAAMYHTTLGGNPAVEAFWRQVSGGMGTMLDADSHAYKLAAFLDEARDPHPEWSAPVRQKFANKHKPNDVEIFATCLRLCAAAQEGTRIETVEKLRERTAQEVAQRVWPLPRPVPRS